MKKQLLIATAVLGLTTSIHAAETDAPAKSPFKNEQEKASYCIGMSIGNSWKRQGVEADPDTVARGIKDVLSGGNVLVTDQEARDTLMAYQQSLRTKQEEKRKEQGEKNKAAGEKFLAANKSKEGVKTLPSGLQYKIITEGKGDSPKAADSVTVHYKGTLIDGTEFDSSYKRGEPASFPVGGVIRGWTEALQLMKPGAKWQLFIPSELAYGENAPPNIGPNSVLQFEVELLSVQPAPPSQPITSDIIRVPSAEEIKKGAKPETIKAEDLEKEMRRQAEQHKPATN
jgi:FKBP-type peptidyl-prolyl cis-trans isomerase FklB